MGNYLRTYARIDLQAIKENILNIKSLLNKGTKLLAVIKADGYGHGALKIAEMLKDKVDYFAVATLDEGIELRKNNIDIPILILGYISKEECRDAIKYDITETVYNLDMAQNINDEAKKQGKIAKIHIALETGMNRIGFKSDDKSINYIKSIDKMENIFLEGMFTHFSCADEKDKDYAKRQLNLYKEFAEKLELNNVNIKLKHVANSAGIIDLEDCDLDMVRSGIITYGLYPSDEVKKEKLKLKPALQWKSHIVNVFKAEKGSKIGYGGTYTAHKDMLVGTISVGYADGYSRSLSNKGRVLIHGKYAPIIGRICMDVMMVDISNINNVKIEDEVTLIGKDGDEEITIEEISSLAGSFNYEFACNIGKRVNRVYL